MRGACLLMGVLMIGQQPPPNLPPARPRITDPARPDFGYSPGWVGSELTVAIVLGPDCVECRESVPLYKRLAQLQVLDGTARRLVFLTQGGIAPVLNMIEQHPQGFKLRGAVSYPSHDWFRTRVLPSIYVIDGAWKRRGEWSGRLTPAQEKDLIALIERITKESRK